MAPAPRSFAGQDRRGPRAVTPYGRLLLERREVCAAPHPARLQRFLELNKKRLEADLLEAIAIVQGLAEGTITEEQFAVWLGRNIR